MALLIPFTGVYDRTEEGGVVRWIPPPPLRIEGEHAERVLTMPLPSPQLPRPELLALEMALHEETERRALEGELLELETAWREAEEIAAIADRLPHDPLERVRGR